MGVPGISICPFSHSRVLGFRASGSGLPPQALAVESRFRDVGLGLSLQFGCGCYNQQATAKTGNIEHSTKLKRAA